MFDDNPLHDATNNSDEYRVVLFLDLLRPLPWFMDVVNRISLFVANHLEPMLSMRRRAVVVDESVPSSDSVELKEEWMEKIDWFVQTRDIFSNNSPDTRRPASQSLLKLYCTIHFLPQRETVVGRRIGIA